MDLTLKKEEVVPGNLRLRKQPPVSQTSPRQAHMAPLACTVYKKNNLLLIVKNAKISYKSLGVGPKGEKYCDYLATFLHGTYWSHQTAPPRTRCAIPDPGHLAHVLLGLGFYTLSSIRNAIPFLVCVSCQKKGNVKAMPGRDCLGSLGLLLGPAGTWAFVELSGTCPS